MLWKCYKNVMNVVSLYYWLPRRSTHAYNCNNANNFQTVLNYSLCLEIKLIFFFKILGSININQTSKVVIWPFFSWIWLVFSGNFHSTRPDSDTCLRVDTCSPSNVSSGNFHWTQATPFFLYTLHLNVVIISGAAPIFKAKILLPF